MSDKEKKEAVEHASRAARQMKHATKNVGEALLHEKEHVVGEAANGVAEAAELGQKMVKRAKPHLNSRIAINVGGGLLALGTALLAANLAAGNFREVFAARKNFARSAAKAAHHIQPSGD